MELYFRFKVDSNRICILMFSYDSCHDITYFELVVMSLYVCIVNGMNLEFILVKIAFFSVVCIGFSAWAVPWAVPPIPRAVLRVNGSIGGTRAVSIQRLQGGGSFLLGGTSGGIADTSRDTACTVFFTKNSFQNDSFSNQILSFPLLITYYDCY